MTENDPLEFDVSNPDDERKWIILYPEDYDNVMLDGEDQVAILVDDVQAGELIRLGCMALADISNRAEHGDDVLRSLIEGLEGELEE